MLLKKLTNHELPCVSRLSVFAGKEEKKSCCKETDTKFKLAKLNAGKIAERKNCELYEKVVQLT